MSRRNHRCAARSLARSPQRKPENVLHLLPTYARANEKQQLDAIIACQYALAHLVYTQSRLVSQSDIQLRCSPT